MTFGRIRVWAEEMTAMQHADAKALGGLAGGHP